MKRFGCRAQAGNSAHLFLCPRCRAQRRVNAAWDRLPGPARSETPEHPREEFVERVVEAVARDRRRCRRRRAAISVAAGLAFFFLAGAGEETRSLETARADEAYARLVAPPALEGLLPE